MTAQKHCCWMFEYSTAASLVSGAKWETSAKPTTAVTETVILISARLESVLSRNKEQIDVNR